MPTGADNDFAHSLKALTEASCKLPMGIATVYLFATPIAEGKQKRTTGLGEASAMDGGDTL